MIWHSPLWICVLWSRSFGSIYKWTVGTDPHTKTRSFNFLLLDSLAQIAVLGELKIQSLSPHKFHSLSFFGLYICIEILGEYKCCWYSVFFPATARICLSSVLRHCSRLCEEKFPRERCVNHLTSFAYLIKEPLDALSAAIWPCSRWKKIPIRSFLCRQNHFSRLIRHQNNNYCYFLLDWFFVSVAL